MNDARRKPRSGLAQSVRRVSVPVRRWAQRTLPPGLRLVVGVMLMIGGVLGFLPVLGFWMFPLGVAIAALDVLPMWRWVRRGGRERK